MGQYLVAACKHPFQARDLLKDSRRLKLIAVAETRGVNHGSSGAIRPRGGRRLSGIIVWKRKPDLKAPGQIFPARNTTQPLGFWETSVVLVYLTPWVRLRFQADLWRRWKAPRRRRAALIGWWGAATAGE